MKTNLQKRLTTKWLIRPTGDPFADAGGFAIEYLSEKFPEKDILQLIDYITKIYVEKWGGKTECLFFSIRRLPNLLFKDHEKRKRH